MQMWSIMANRYSLKGLRYNNKLTTLSCYDAH